MGIIFADKGTITSNIGERWGRMHKGTDYAVPTGTIVQSVTSGTVVYTGNDPDGYGNYIKVQDPDGNTHVYAHLSSIGTTTGSIVKAGQQIGLSGSTGKSTGPHVHYEVKDSGGNVLDGTKFISGVKDVALIDGTTVAYQTLTTNTTTDTSGNGLKIMGFDITDIAVKVCIFFVLLILGGLGAFFLFKTFDIKPSLNPVKLMKGEITE